MPFLDQTTKGEEQLLDEQILIDVFGFPPSLAKAYVDEFDYAIGLRNGTIIYFSKASYAPGSKWVHLSPHPSYDSDWKQGIQAERRIQMPLERGIDIRLSEIAWCADAPFGS